jgi:hypothetical protein
MSQSSACFHYVDLLSVSSTAILIDALLLYITWSILSPLPPCPDIFCFACIFRNAHIYCSRVGAKLRKCLLAQRSKCGTGPSDRPSIIPFYHDPDYSASIRSTMYDRSVCDSLDANVSNAGLIQGLFTHWIGAKQPRLDIKRGLDQPFDWGSPPSPKTIAIASPS